MKIIDIFEKRSNAEMNEKVPVNFSIINRVSRTRDKVSWVKNVFVSFTMLDKLGINPKSRYNTPLGIYAYPGEYVWGKIGDSDSMTKLPFAGNQPYVNLFSVNGNIVNLTRMYDETADEYYSKLPAIISAIRPKFKNREEFLKQTIEDSYEYSRKKTAGGRFWYVTYRLSNILGENNKAPIIWNKIFRMLGIDGCIDEGDGIIHPSEPTQAVFFSKSIIYDVERVLNKYSGENIVKSKVTADNHRTLAAEINSLPTAFHIASRIIKSGEYSLINRISDPKIREEVLLTNDSLLPYVKFKLSPQLQRRLIDNRIFSIRDIPGVDQQVVLDFLNANGSSISLYALEEIRKGIPKIGSALSKKILELIAEKQK